MVILRDLLNVMRSVIIDPLTANIYIEREDDLYGSISEHLKTDGWDEQAFLKALKPYMDYEVTSFYQNWVYGGYDGQELWLKEVVAEK